MSDEPETTDAMYKRVIQSTMDEEDIDPYEIEIETTLDINHMKNVLRGLSLRYHRTKDVARFRCACGHSWISTHAWCVLDLRIQSLAHKFGQKCKKCESEATPVFDEDSMKRMARYAIGR